jgi:aminocarboxymuconate-semialdehyde decarboxylase
VHAWNVTAKAKEALKESPAETAKRFFYDELVFDPLAIRFLVDRFGASQIVLGSDYPFNMADTDTVGTLGKAGLDAATVAAISAGNAKRFLALK